MVMLARAQGEGRRARGVRVCVHVGVQASARARPGVSQGRARGELGAGWGRARGRLVAQERGAQAGGGQAEQRWEALEGGAQRPQLRGL